MYEVPVDSRVTIRELDNKNPIEIPPHDRAVPNSQRILSLYIHVPTSAVISNLEPALTSISERLREYSSKFPQMPFETSHEIGQLLTQLMRAFSRAWVGLYDIWKDTRLPGIRRALAPANAASSKDFSSAIEDDRFCCAFY